MKKILSIILAVVMVLGSMSFVMADDGIKITINGEAKTFDVMPQIIDGRTLVPMRAIFEALGAEVGWDDATKTATGKTASTTVSLTIDKKAAKVNNKVIGNVGLNNIDKSDIEAEIGICINPTYWGHDIATELVKEILKFAFNNTNVQTIIANTYKDNKRTNVGISTAYVYFEVTDQNYIVTNWISCELTINPKPVSLTLKQSEFTYTGNPIEVEVLVEGVLDGESVCPSLQNYINTNASVYHVNVISLNNNNYKIIKDSNICPRCHDEGLPRWLSSKDRLPM